MLLYVPELSLYRFQNRVNFKFTNDASHPQTPLPQAPSFLLLIFGLFSMKDSSHKVFYLIIPKKALIILRFLLFTGYSILKTPVVPPPL
jgi:hypothetical protein